MYSLSEVLESSVLNNLYFSTRCLTLYYKLYKCGLFPEYRSYIFLEEFNQGCCCCFFCSLGHLFTCVLNLSMKCFKNTGYFHHEFETSVILLLLILVLVFGECMGDLTDFNFFVTAFMVQGLSGTSLTSRVYNDHLHF